MISLAEAQQLVTGASRSFGIEHVPIDEVTGRVLQQAIIADRDYPPFNRATMDGIAIHTADWNEGIRAYRLVETIFAGAIATQQISKGECYKIMTGAAVPADANAVIRREDIDLQEDRVCVNVSRITDYQNIALKGSDIVAGDTILNQPQLITPGAITSLASLGYSEVAVAKLPSVAIITTGDEVKPVDALLSAVQIRNSNAHLLKSLLRQWHIRPAYCRHAADDARHLTEIIKSQLHNDLIILSGAVSAGDADFVPEVLQRAGAKKIFHKVAIRPGKPIWFGKFENGPIVFALPGNPFSTFVTFKLFIELFLRGCLGLQQQASWLLPFNGHRVKKNELDEFFPVKLNADPLTATAIPFNNSGDITTMLHAAGLGWQPSGMLQLEHGTPIQYLPSK